MVPESARMRGGLTKTLLFNGCKRLHSSHLIRRKIHKSDTGQKEEEEEGNETRRQKELLSQRNSTQWETNHKLLLVDDRVDHSSVPLPVISIYKYETFAQDDFEHRIHVVFLKQVCPVA